MVNYTDVLIIGAGPAGLATADELSTSDICDKLDVTLIDKANKFGGNGGNTDNKWNILKADTKSKTGFWHLIADRGGVWNRQYIEDMTYLGQSIMEKLMKQDKKRNWQDLGEPGRYRYDSESYDYWEKTLGKNNLLLEPLEQFHVGTTRGNILMQRWGQELQQRGVNTQLNTEALNIEKTNQEDYNFKITTDKGDYFAKYCVLAPGRARENYGDDILSSVMEPLGLETIVNAVDYGVRIEFDNRAMWDITQWKGNNGIYDPKIETITPTGDEMRTFCANLRGGHLALEIKYVNGNKMVLVNGESSPEDHGNNPANLAILQTFNLKEPGNDPIEWTIKQLDIIRHLTTGLGETPRAVIQRMGDFLGNKFYELNPWLLNYKPGYEKHNLILPTRDEWDSRRSKYRDDRYNSFNREDFFKSTLDKRTQQGKGQLLGTPGNIRIAFNNSFVNNLEVMLFRLGNVFPMILHPSSVIAGPEVKYYARRALADLWSETNISGLYVGGDGGRGTHGIAPSVVNGFNIGQGIKIKYLGIEPEKTVYGKKIQVSPDYVGISDKKI